MMGKSGPCMFPPGKNGNAMPLATAGIGPAAMLGSALTMGLLGIAGHYAGSISKEYGLKHAELKRRVKIMESKRMQRTADARAMSKKNLVFAFVELGRQFDESANTIADLRVRLDASQSVAKIHGEEMTKRRDVLPKLDRAYEEIRRMRKLLAHYLESDVGA